MYLYYNELKSFKKKPKKKPKKQIVFSDRDRTIFFVGPVIDIVPANPPVPAVAPLGLNPPVPVVGLKFKVNMANYLESFFELYAVLKDNNGSWNKSRMISGTCAFQTTLQASRTIAGILSFSNFHAVLLDYPLCFVGMFIFSGGELGFLAGCL